MKLRVNTFFSTPQHASTWQKNSFARDLGKEGEIIFFFKSERWHSLSAEAPSLPFLPPPMAVSSTTSTKYGASYARRLRKSSGSSTVGLTYPEETRREILS